MSCFHNILIPCLFVCVTIRETITSNNDVVSAAKMLHVRDLGHRTLKVKIIDGTEKLDDGRDETNNNSKVTSPCYLDNLSEPEVIGFGQRLFVYIRTMGTRTPQINVFWRVR